MKYEIIGGQLPAVVCKLDRGEKMFTESGGMCWMEEGISMDSNTRGGLLKAVSYTHLDVYKRQGISLALLQVHFIDIVVRLNELFKQHMQPPSLLSESAHCLHCVKRFYSP